VTNDETRMGCHLIVNSWSSFRTHAAATSQWVCSSAILQIMSRLVDLQPGYEGVAFLVSGVCKGLTLLPQIPFAG
jgi:hypothetical protein